MTQRELIPRTVQRIPVPLWDRITKEAARMKITPQRYLEKVTVIYNG